MVKKLLLSVCCAMALGACSVIDENLGDCVDEENYRLDYELWLVTNMTTELQTQLSLQTDVNMVQALRSHLASIFTDHAHDVDLSFYTVGEDSARIHHEEHIIDANQSSYTLNMTRSTYMHHAVANKQDNPVVSLLGDDRCHKARLTQMAGDTISSHNTGIFTARQLMEMVEDISQQFDVHLYMANCAVTLVVDTTAAPIAGMRVFSTGFASAFNIADSVYVYDTKPAVIRTQRIEDGADGLVSFCSVNFPSRDNNETRTVIETEEPFLAENAGEALWQFLVYVTLADGSITETRLQMAQAVRAGQLKIVRARLHNDGSVSTEDQTVGVSVTLNWNNGGQHDVPL